MTMQEDKKAQQAREDAEFAAAFNEGEEGFGIAPAPDVDAETNGDAAGEGVTETGATTTTTSDADPMAAALTRQEEGGGVAAPEASAEAAADNGGASADTGAPDVTVAVAAPEGDAPSVEAAPGEAAPGADGDDMPTDPKELQRAKSWEGRMKAREADLAKREDALKAKATETGQPVEEVASDAIDAVADDASASPDLKAAAETVASAVESGQMTAEEAVAQLTEDFGDGFTKLLDTMISSRVDAAMKPLRDDLDGVKSSADEIVSHISNSQERAHFERLTELAPDWMDVAKDPSFTEFVDAQGKQAVRDGGTAKEVAALVSEFKASKGADETAESTPAETGSSEPGIAERAVATAPAHKTLGPSDEEVDSAAAVRGSGGGMSLPKAPGSKDDFEAGWNDTPDA